MRLQEFLGVDHPIIQAPMAGVQNSNLTIAVCEAGALGSLPCAMLSATQMQAELEQIRSATSKPFNVNFFCHKEPEFDREKEHQWRKHLAPYFKQYDINPEDISIGSGRRPFSHEIADVIESFRPPVVSFHFGLPDSDLLARVKGWGSTVLSSATTVKEAEWLEANGAMVLSLKVLRQAGTGACFCQKI